MTDLDAALVDDEEPLPGAEDPYWDELTAETLAHLRVLRTEHRRRRLRNIAFAGYAAALVALIWGVPYVSYAVRQVRAGHPYDTVSGELLAALPAASTAVFMVALLALVRDAAWRGPVLVDTPTAAWLLPLPIRWAAFLRPRFRIALVLSALAGAVGGGVLGFLLYVTGLADIGAGVGSGGAAGGLVTLLGTGLAGLEERYGAESRDGGWLPHWWVPASWLAVLLLAGQAALAVAGYRSAWLEAVELWSGPWGWVTQPMVAAAGGDAPWWPVALAVAAVSAVACAWVADRAVGDVSGAALRARARTVASVSAALATLDLRQASLAVRTAEGRLYGMGRSLRPPRYRWLLLPWRDLSGLLRAPARLGWGLVWLVVAGLAAAMASQGRGAGAAVVLVLALVSAYLSAAQLAEGARLEADDTRRSMLLPYRYGDLALWHAVVPVVLLLAGTGLGAGGLALLGGPVLAAGVLVLAAPALVGAALVSAYRGTLPVGLLVSVYTPLGGTAPVQIALWYFRGPLVAIGALTAVLYPALRSGTVPTDTLTDTLPETLTDTLPGAAVVGLGMLGWAFWQARHLYRA